MSWLESIDIRFNQGDVEKLIKEYLYPLLDKSEGTCLENALVFRKSSFAHQSSYSSCIQVFLVWSGQIHCAKSSLGLVLVDMLKNFGMIEHTVWEQCYHRDLSAKAI